MDDGVFIVFERDDFKTLIDLLKKAVDLLGSVIDFQREHTDNCTLAPGKTHDSGVENGEKTAEKRRGRGA